MGIKRDGCIREEKKKRDREREYMCGVVVAAVIKSDVCMPWCVRVLLFSPLQVQEKPRKESQVEALALAHIISTAKQQAAAEDNPYSIFYS
jgi:hypothetical protein